MNISILLSTNGYPDDYRLSRFESDFVIKNIDTHFAKCTMDQRHFVAALCMKSQGVTDKRYASVTVRRNVISSLIGLSAEAAQGGLCALDQANERLRSLGLVDEDWQPINWE